MPHLPAQALRDLLLGDQLQTPRSPWLHQLRPDRTIDVLQEDTLTDVAIVGAGIAGVCTAYFTLKNTDHSVLLIEADKVAHGATGHNAGQMVSYFERQVSGLVEEFGLELTAQAQNAVDSAWVLFDEMYRDAGLTTPYAQFTGYAGCQDLPEILLHLENIVVCRQANIPAEPIMIAGDSPLAEQIPPKYAGLYTLVSHRQVLDLLETNDKRYVAVLSARKGCMNSALFCEDLILHLQQRYAERFRLVEKSPMHSVDLKRDHVVLHLEKAQVVAKKVVLCTNGFENFTLRNTIGPDVDTSFHALVNGCVGYMAAYLEDKQFAPISLSYLPAQSQTGNAEFDDNPYFYLTRREFELEPNRKHNLVCVGGPEVRVDDSSDYKKEHPYPEEAQRVIDEFLHTTYAHSPAGKIQYHYKWHGLMGYTPNGVRCIGPEPHNPTLLYNLGCNGVGILPSIYGGKKISQFLHGDQLSPSIFDPKRS